MNDQVRVRALTAMFHAFGAASPEQIDAFDRAISPRARCETCYVLTCQELARTSPKRPAPSHWLAANSDLFGREHMHHIGMNAAEDGASRVEAFWRKVAPPIIRAKTGCDAEHALGIAASMWWTGVVAAEEAVVRIEAEHPLWTYEASRPISRAVIEHRFAGARRAHVLSPSQWTDEEWDAWVAEENRLLLAAKGIAA